MFGEFVSRLKNLFGVSTPLSEADRAEELSRIGARREVDAMMQKEAEHAERSREELGSLISVIHFQVRAAEDEAEHFPDGIIPWIGIATRIEEKERLIDGDELVLAAKTATVMIDYPLDTPTILDLKSESGDFSRWRLIEEIGRKYEEIYLEEETTAQTKTLPMSERRIMNRNQTDGNYGIWGHDLSDLAISLIEVRKNASDEIILWLGMES